MSDPYWSSVKLLVSFDGSDTSTTFVDTSDAARTVTAVGSGQLDTAQKKFGTASLECAGTADGATTTTVTGMAMAGDFTVEGWFRITGYGIVLQIDYSGGYVQITADADFLDVTSTEETIQSTVLPVVYNTWHHFAWVRSGTGERIYLDGVHEYTFTSTVETITPTAIKIGYGSVSGDLPGHVDEVRISVGQARYTANFTPPSAAFEVGAPVVYEGRASALGPLGTPTVKGHTLYGKASAAGPLGTPTVRGHLLHGRASCAGPLGSPAAVAVHDFTGQLGSAPITYRMSVSTPGGDVEIPISSWQATMTTDGLSYTQCVIPSYLPLADTLADATEFTVYRRATLPDGSSIDYPMATTPISQLSFASGAFNQSCTLSGYTDAFTAEADPPDGYDRYLTGIRTMFSGTSGIRVRCSIDWLLRPGHRAWLDDTTSIIVKYINLYVPEAGGDEYMDVGELVAE